MNDDYEVKTDGSYVFDDDDIESNRTYAILAYVLFFIPLILAKESKYARFHANQSLLITIMLVTSLLLGLIPTFGWILRLAGIGVFVIVQWFEGIFAAIAGRVRRARLYGQFNVIRL